MGITFGLQLWNQVYTWPEAREAAIRAEQLGFDGLWTWEHALACMGSPDQPTFDAYTLLAGWSQVTSRVTLGVLTGANTYWNPALLAKKATTLDHISDGRAILGIGAGWFEPEHIAYGIEFGSGWGDRLAWLDESVSALRRLLDGETVTSAEGGRYSLREAVLSPRPVQSRLPILVGGAGERKTLRTIARYADIWNWVGLRDLESMRAKHEIFERRCEEQGRDPSEIVRSAFFSPVIRDSEADALSFFRSQMAANRLPDSVLDDDDIYVTTPERLTELMVAWKEIGVSDFIVEIAAPFDDETAERIATEIRPIVDAA